MILAAAIVASGLGAVARYVLGASVHARLPRTRPWGTAAVNLLGAVLLGMLAGMHADGRLPTAALTVAGTGFLGGFTTFSTWMLESVGLGRSGDAGALTAAAVNVGGMLVAGIVGVALASWAV